MNNAKRRTTHLKNHVKLSKGQSPKAAKKHEYMTLVLYAYVVGSLMYAMVCTRPDITQAVKIVSMYKADPAKKYWKLVK